MVWDARQRAILRTLDRLSQAERRRWMRQERADALRTVQAAKAAGLPMRAVTIAGVTYELGQLEGTREAQTDDEVERWIAEQKARTDAR